MGKHRDKRGVWRLFIVEWREWGEWDSGKDLVRLLVMERRVKWLLAPSKREALRMVRLHNSKQMHNVCATLAQGE